MDNLEREIQNYNDMGTSIDNLKTEFQMPERPTYNPSRTNYTDREPFRDNIDNRKQLRDDLGKDCKNCDKKDFSVNNFVKDLEKNLDNFDNLDFQSGPLPSNINIDFQKQKNKNKEIIEVPIIKKKKVKKVKKENTWDKNIYKFLLKIREPLIVVLLFILLNNNELIDLINRIPNINYFNNDYPSLIIRGIILAFIIYNLRNLTK